MKLNLDQPLKGHNDETLKSVSLDEEKKPVSKDLTLKEIVYNSFMGDPIPGDDKLTGKEKKRIWDLAEKIYPGGEVNFELEEVTLMKDRVGQYYLPKIVGPAWKLLEGE